MPLEQAIAEATGAIPTLKTVSVHGYDVLLPGRYTGIKGGANDYSADDLDGIAAAHDDLKDVIRPVVKLGHGPQELAGEYPNSGTISRAYVQGGRLKVDLDNVPAKIGALMKAGNLPSRSAEMLFNVTHNGKTYPKVLTGLALLGESLPAVRGLNDVLARYQSAETPTDVLLSATDVDEVLLADAPTKTEGGKAYPKSDYAYTPSDSPSDWKLRLTAEPGGDPDPGIVGAAVAALGAGFRGQKVDIPSGDLAAVKAKVRAAWTKANPDKKAADMPKTIALAAAAPPVSASDKAAAAAADCKNPAHADMPMAVHKKLHMPKQAALSLDLDEVRNAVEDALQDAYPANPALDYLPVGSPLAPNDDGPSAWIETLYDDQVVVWDQDHDSYWLIPYTFDAASSTATLDTEGAKVCRLVPQVITGADAELADPAAITPGAGSVPPQPNALTTDYAPHLAAAQQHLAAVGDLLNKMSGKHGIGPARAMHRELSSKVDSLKKKLVPPDSATEATQHAAATAAIGAAMSAPTEETMTDAEIRVLLSLPPEADIKQELIKLKATHVELSDHQAVVAERDTLRAEHEAFLAEKRDADAVQLVDKAVADTKVLPKMRDWAVGYAKADPEGFQTYLSQAPSLWQAGEIGRTGQPIGVPGEQPAREPNAAMDAKLGITQADLADTRTFAERFKERLHQEATKAGYASALFAQETK